MQIQPIIIQTNHVILIEDVLNLKIMTRASGYSIPTQYFFIDKGASETIGIEDVQRFLMPLQLVLEKKTYAIINSAQNLTLEAQNFLLKILEEPIDNLQLVLVETVATSNEKLLIDTIYSRCIVYKQFSDNDTEEELSIGLIVENFLEKLSEKTLTTGQVTSYLNLFLQQAFVNSSFNDDLELIEFISNCLEKNINLEIIKNLLLFKIYLKEKSPNN